MKTIEERADEYARSQCAGDCALCEDICCMTSAKSAFIAGARSEREEQTDVELFEAGAAEYYAQHAFTENDRAFAERHFKEGAAWMQVELTRWHDPKEELPDGGKLVLLKITNGSHYVLAQRGDECWWSQIDEEWGIPDSRVIGWREIHE